MNLTLCSLATLGASKMEFVIAWHAPDSQLSTIREAMEFSSGIKDLYHGIDSIVLTGYLLRLHRITTVYDHDRRFYELLKANVDSWHIPEDSLVEQMNLVDFPEPRCSLRIGSERFAQFHIDYDTYDRVSPCFYPEDLDNWRQVLSIRSWAAYVAEQEAQAAKAATTISSTERNVRRLDLSGR